jgi:methionyl-tRNA synthetase
MRLVMALADRANPFVEENAPWNLKKDATQASRLKDVCTIALNLFRQLAVYLAPVLPRLARQAGELFDRPIAKWTDAYEPIVATPVRQFHHMLKRITAEEVQKMTDESREEAAAVPTGTASAPQDSADALQAEPLAAECSIDDFAKVDLRVARVIAAEDVPEARKLLKLTVSLGGDVRRTVFAGIKSAYAPEKLVGRLVIIVANLAPRQMKFGLSEGMVCASGSGGAEVYLLSPDSGAVPGQRVH